MSSVQAEQWLKSALGNGFDPFPWQERLLSDLLEGKLPRALDLPTGLGKTSVMAIWLVARACGASQLPRRLVYVVDRRAVVDQATRVAEGLAQWVGETEVVRAALGVDALAVSTLRGQFADNRRWLDDPSAPAIVVGTVDKIGSRLLFEGYACSRKMRPYHAAFLGCDSLIVVDEAHLVPPFERTIEELTSKPLWPRPPMAAGSPSQLLSLSATGRSHSLAFRLDAKDHGHREVQRRITARKSLQWVDLKDKDSLADALAQSAWDLVSTSAVPRRVIVFSNRRDDAEKAIAALRRLVKSVRERGAALPACEILVGGRRLRERQIGERRLVSLGFLAGEQREPLEDHAFLFTTSAGEVGVDLDADDAVADVVAWERMVQRLGRVNRRGQTESRVVVLAHPEKNEWIDAVRVVVECLPSPDVGQYQVDLASLGALKEHESDCVDAASTPEPLRPELTLPLVEAWAMTSLRHHTGRPEVGPWLRGWIDDEPQTDVLWRRWLPNEQREEYLEAAPPHASEVLATATYRAASWLLARAKRIAARSADAEESIKTTEVVAWVVDGAGELESTLEFGRLLDPDKRTREQIERLLPGRRLVVDARLGGLSIDGLLDDKENDSPQTFEDSDWDIDPAGRPVVPVRVRIARASDDTVAPAQWRETLRLPWGTGVESEDVSEWLLVERWRTEPTSEEGRSSMGGLQRLDAHQQSVVKHVERIATNLGLPEALRRVLSVAACYHDEGKRAERWQRAFSAPDGGPYAKTPGPVRVRWLNGYRHELSSLVQASESPEFAALSPEDQDLALHLIAAHHGSGRPTIQTTGCDDALPSAVEARAREVALRFVLLQERWGPWRLAWLEAILRAADQTASRVDDQTSTVGS